MRQVEQRHADEALREAITSVRWWRNARRRNEQQYAEARRLGNDIGARIAWPCALAAKGRMREAQSLARTLCGVRWGGYLRLER